MLFDPAEEQLDLPAGAVELRDEQGRQVKIVGEKDQAQVLLGVEIVDAPQGCGIATRTLASGQANGLIGTQPLGVIDPTPGASTVAHILLGTGDEESQRLRDPIQTPVIDGENRDRRNVYQVVLSREETLLDGGRLSEEKIHGNVSCLSRIFPEMRTAVIATVQKPRRYRRKACAPSHLLPRQSPRIAGP